VLVWLNGRFVPAQRARVSALDRGLLHGDGLYETWRTYEGWPFAVAAHLARLGRAARLLGLPAPGPAPRWTRRSSALVRRNGFADAAVRLTITRGDAGDMLVPTRRTRPTVLLTVRALPEDLARQQRDGIRVILLPFPRDAGPPWGGFKLLGHVSAIVGRQLALRRRAGEALYVTPDGSLTEGTTSNLFVVEDGVVKTPPLTSGVLPGVTRSLVCSLARRAGARVSETPLTGRHLARAAEAFVTASTIEIVPVVRVGGRPIGRGVPGPITRLLQAHYADTVARARPRHHQ